MLHDIFLASIFVAYVEPTLFLLSHGKILQCSPYQRLLHQRIGAPQSLPAVAGRERCPFATGRGGTLEVVFKYGTTLHMRYPAPIVASGASGLRLASPAMNDEDNGLVPVVVQQPVLYSASAILDNPADDKPAGQ